MCPSPRAPLWHRRSAASADRRGERSRARRGRRRLLELSPGAEEQAEVLGPPTRDGDVMYSITADCGRLQPLPAEPLSTGIDMSPVTQYGVPIRRAPVSSPAKTWSGKLKPT